MGYRVKGRAKTYDVEDELGLVRAQFPRSAAGKKSAERAAGQYNAAIKSRTRRHT